MRPPCPTCGARLDDDGTCPRCELEPVPLSDADLGIRREDRYVALPPGPRWVPRRIRRESPLGPVVVLAAVLGVLGLMVVLAPRDDDARPATVRPPLLDEPTGVVLLRGGPWGVEEIDLDAGTIRSADSREPPPATGTTLDLSQRTVALTPRVTVAQTTCDTGRCVAVTIDGTTVVEIAEPRVATLAPTTTTLALLGLEESALVDLPRAAVTPVAPGAGPRDVTAWSPDGRWLFVATQDGGVDAIRTDGERFRVPAGARATDWIAVTHDGSQSGNTRGP